MVRKKKKKEASAKANDFMLVSNSGNRQAKAAEVVAPEMNLAAQPSVVAIRPFAPTYPTSGGTFPSFRQSTQVNHAGLPSVGSLGHPHYCAGACKYLRKQGGCRDGSTCPCCHMCQFSRKRQTKRLPPSGASQIVSIKSCHHKQRDVIQLDCATCHLHACADVGNDHETNGFCKEARCCRKSIERGWNTENRPANTVDTMEAEFSLEATDPEEKQVPADADMGHLKIAALNWNTEGVTTLMVCNIHCSYTEFDVMAILDANGLKGAYDFVFMPQRKNSTSHASFGYFFVHVKRPGSVDEFISALVGKQFGPLSTGKMCDVRAAKQQDRDLVHFVAYEFHASRRILSLLDDMPQLVDARSLCLQ